MKKTYAFSLTIAIVVLALYYVFFGASPWHSKTYKLSHRLSVIANALEAYKQEHGNYPATETGLIALVRSTGKDPYFKTSRAFVDPWGNQLVYYLMKNSISNEVEGYTIFSLGPNGLNENGSGDDIVVTSPRRAD